MSTSRDDYLREALRILKEVPLIDGHNDWPCNVRGWFANNISDPSHDLNSVGIGQTDLNRLSRGRVGGQFWSAYVSCPPRGDELSDDAHLGLVRKTLQQIDLIHLMVEKHSDKLALAEDSAAVWDVFRSGRIACLIGLEGLHQVAHSFSCLRMYRRLGVRYVTLTHNSSNAYADSATAPTVLHGGLSEGGRQMIEEMNRSGIMVDLSHTSHDAQKEALAVSRAPVIFSHSSCNRNVTDETLQLLKQNGGIIMICFLRNLVTRPRGGDSDDSGSPSLHDVADHIIYAGRLIGYEHVGLGSDFDGMLNGPAGLDEVSDFPYLVAELLARGVNEENVKAVAGLNVLRVMDKVDKVRREMLVKRLAAPAADEIPPFWTKEERKMLVDEGACRNARRAKGNDGVQKN